jgi:large subunit ribosomal protein L6
MSRIGKMPIPVPEGVKVNLEKGLVTVTGPKGELRRHLNPDIGIKLENNNLIVSRPSDGKTHRSLHGLTRSLLANMVEGVTKGFDKSLEIVGVGYRAEKAGGGIAPSRCLPGGRGGKPHQGIGY